MIRGCVTQLVQQRLHAHVYGAPKVEAAVGTPWPPRHLIDDALEMFPVIRDHIQKGAGERHTGVEEVDS